MPHKPAYDPTDPRYYDEKDLRSEVERIFGLCADCRMCVKFCGSFPKMFDAVDDYCTEGKYAEVDTKKFKSEDLKQVVDLCFQCKLCYIKCPYTPGDHDWAIDFPRLIARAKAQEVKKNGVPLTDKLLGRPDLVGKLGTATAPLSNWGNENSLNRKLMHSVVGIHKDKKLPPFASKTFAAQFESQRKPLQGEPAAKIAFFSTCYVNYNQPEIGTNRSIVATNPTCSQMIRVEYPRLLGTEDAKKVAAQTMDPMEFLAGLASQGKLNKNFKTGAGKISYHMPCHLRAQNVGYKTRDVLSLLPETIVRVVEECSGHDGTWAIKKEIFEQSLKWGSRAFKEMAEGNPKVTCSDCPLAAIQIEQGNGQRPLNPMQLLARSYRGKAIG